MSKGRWLWGRHPVVEALRARSRSMVELWVQEGIADASSHQAQRLARRANLKIRRVPRAELDRVSAGGSHQGLALMTGERAADDFGAFLEGLDESRKRSLVLVALDQIQDPQNLGAIARSAACLGAAGLILPERRSAPVTQAVSQASAGAIERIQVFCVGNLAQALVKLKAAGFWIYGADRSGTASWKVTFNAPMVLVVGSEGTGMRPVVLERCDEVAAVPQSPDGVDSLNASCAASVLLYEAARQLKGGK